MYKVRCKVFTILHLPSIHSVTVFLDITFEVDLVSKICVFDLLSAWQPSTLLQIFLKNKLVDLALGLDQRLLTML